MNSLPGSRSVPLTASGWPEGAVQRPRCATRRCSRAGGAGGARDGGGSHGTTCGSQAQFARALEHDARSTGPCGESAHRLAAAAPARLLAQSQCPALRGAQLARERNAQFDHIAAERARFAAAGIPSSAWTRKKKELIGNYRNGGRAWCKTPEAGGARLAAGLDRAGRAVRHLRGVCQPRARTCAWATASTRDALQWRPLPTGGVTWAACLTAVLASCWCWPMRVAPTTAARACGRHSSSAVVQRLRPCRDRMPLPHGLLEMEPDRTPAGSISRETGQARRCAAVPDRRARHRRHDHGHRSARDGCTQARGQRTRRTRQRPGLVASSPAHEAARRLPAMNHTLRPQPRLH